MCGCCCGPASDPACGRTVAAGDRAESVVMELLSRIDDLAAAGVVTIYYGADAGQAEAGQLSTEIHRCYPALEVAAIHGDQPHYDYIVSVE